jgi:hypothetical protein
VILRAPRTDCARGAVMRAWLHGASESRADTSAINVKQTQGHWCRSGKAAPQRLEYVLMIRFRSSFPSRRPLFATSLCALALSALLPGSAAQAATRVVSNCNDSGAGSLRNAIAGALSGDTIDMTGLTCSRILLTGGEIVAPQRSLYLIGRSRSALTIDGNASSRVFRHNHIGRFRLTQLTIANGRATDGGCILSEFGEVELVRSRIRNCVSVFDSSTFTGARGGAIWARVALMTDSAAHFNSITASTGQGGAIWAGTVRLLRSQVYGNQAWHGGGIYSSFNEGSISLSYSLVKDNVARMQGGGLYVAGAGSLTVNKSTIVGNRSLSDDAEGGGIYGYTWNETQIVDSTISGNRAATRSAVSTSSQLRIHNSTIAFNVETFECDAAVPQQRVISSSIIARNTCLAGQGYDVNDASYYTTDSLIERPRYRVSSDTIVADPRLAPLANNGGPTPTHALMADSPALERGNNGLQRAYDQRGPGFPRVRGAFPDIGAFER